jgi:phosphinothricin acetyltransferase
MVVLCLGTLLPVVRLSVYPRYRFSVEVSLYLRHDQCGRGFGTVLLADMVAAGREGGYHTLISIISGDQDASIALHKRAGFTLAGCLTQTGFKFGRWLDVVFYQLMLPPVA